jgi:predicted PurR-regulated permease PerM
VRRAPTRFEKVAFGVVFAVAAFFFLWTLSPVWVPVFLGILLALVARPLKSRIERRFHRHPRLLSAAITIVCISAVLGLVAFVFYVVVQELSHLVKDVIAHADDMSHWLHSPRVLRWLGRFGGSPEQIQSSIRSLSTSLLTHTSTVLGSVLSLTSHALLLIFFTSLTAYYLLLEGGRLTQFAVRLSPLPMEETVALLSEFHDVSIGTLLGIGVICLVQGVAAGIGFAIFGVASAVVWGALTGVASLVPTIGTALVCFPIAGIEFMHGRTLSALGLLLWWGFAVVALPDYYLRPRLLRGHMRLHSLLVFIALFGGLEAFGVMGLLLGPLFVAFFVALLRIYERDYRPQIARS